MAGDQSNWRTCFSFYACDVPEPDEQGGEALSAPRDYDKAKRLIAESGYKGERIVILDPADIPQIHAEALVTSDLLKRLGLNVRGRRCRWQCPAFQFLDLQAYDDFNHGRLIDA